MAQPTQSGRASITSPTEGGAQRGGVAGWRFTFVAGMVPLIAGLVTLVTTWLGVARSDAPWPTGPSTLGFSFSSLPAAGGGLQDWVELTGSVGGVNVMAAAIAVSVVARFGLRDGHRWAWWFLAFCLVWIGVHERWLPPAFSPVPVSP